NSRTPGEWRTGRAGNQHSSARVQRTSSFFTIEDFPDDHARGSAGARVIAALALFSRDDAAKRGAGGASGGAADGSCAQLYASGAAARKTCGTGQTVGRPGP